MNEVYTFSNCDVNFVSGEFYKNGCRRHVSPADMRVLELLIKNQGNLLSYSELYRVACCKDSILPLELNEDMRSVIRVYIYRLRKAIGDKNMIKYFNGGYTFIQPVFRRRLEYAYYVPEIRTEPVCPS